MKLRTFPPHSFGGQTAGPGDQQGRDGGGGGGGERGMAASRAYPFGKFPSFLRDLRKFASTL